MSHSDDVVAVDSAVKFHKPRSLLAICEEAGVGMVRAKKILTDELDATQTDGGFCYGHVIEDEEDDED